MTLLFKLENLEIEPLIFQLILANSDNTPTTIHLALSEFPRLSFSFAELDGRNSRAFGFAVVGNNKGVTHIHEFKWIGTSFHQSGEIYWSFFD